MRCQIKQLFIVLVLSNFWACSQMNESALLSGGELVDKAFATTIPYEDAFGLIVAEAEVSGVKGRFLVDTGAPMVLTPEFAKKVQIQAITTPRRANDSGQNSAAISFGKIPNLSIGGTMFKDIGTAIFSLDSSVSLRCLHLDGVIGSNLMNKAFWQFNFGQHTITFSDDIKKLRVDRAEITKIPFSPNYYDTPLIDLQTPNGKLKKVALDLGSNAGLGLPKDHSYFKKYRNRFNLKKSYGISGVGAFGLGKKDSIFRSEIMITNSKITKKVPLNTIFYATDEKTLGLAYLSKFTLTIDWAEKAVFLERNSNPIERDNPRSFSTLYKDGFVIVNTVVIGSKAYEAGLRPGMQILHLDHQNMETLTEQEYCELLHKLWNPVESSEEKIITVKTENNKEVKTYVFSK